MSLDQLPMAEQLDQRRAGAGVQVAAQVLLRRRIQRPAHLDMEVPVHLDPGEHRHVIGRAERQQGTGLLLGEDLRRAGGDGAVDAHPGHLLAPPFSRGLRVGQPGKVLAGEEVPAHVLHGPLHLRLVPRGADPRRVGGEPAVLGVVQPARGEPRVHRVRIRDDRRGVAGDQDLEHAAEERPRGLAPGDERGQRLGERQPDKQVPGIAGSEDQRTHPALPPGHRVGQQAQIPEIQLTFGAGLAIGDPHRRCRAAKTAPLHAEPVQRPVGHHNALPLQQHPDLDHRQARLRPLHDLHLAGLQLLPRQAVPARPRRADHLRDLADQIVRQLSQAAVASQPSLDPSLHIPAGGLAVYSGLLGYPAQPCTR
jgi:hypothetical protein